MLVPPTATIVVKALICLKICLNQIWKKKKKMKKVEEKNISAYL